MSKAPIQLLLWDALRPIAEALGIPRPKHRPVPESPPPVKPQRKPRAKEVAPASAVERGGMARSSGMKSSRKPQPNTLASKRPSMERRYAEVADLMLRTYGVRVRKWRTSMSGVAWCVIYRDGSIARLIESPKPKGPMSMAVFLHEIGHHAIGFDVYSPRCLEEFHAWEFSIRAMKEHGLNITEKVERRRRRSLEYAVGKACRRGIKQIPAELEGYIPARYRPNYASGATPKR